MQNETAGGHGAQKKTRCVMMSRNVTSSDRQMIHLATSILSDSLQRSSWSEAASLIRQDIHHFCKLCSSISLLILLFLMNLERIEVYERMEDSPQPSKLFRVGISASCLDEVRKAREEFKTKVQENASSLSSGSFPEVKTTYHRKKI